MERPRVRTDAGEGHFAMIATWRSSSTEPPALFFSLQKTRHETTHTTLHSYSSLIVVFPCTKYKLQTTNTRTFTRLYTERLSHSPFPIGIASPRTRCGHEGHKSFLLTPQADPRSATASSGILAPSCCSRRLGRRSPSARAQSSLRTGSDASCRCSVVAAAAGVAGSSSAVCADAGPLGIVDDESGACSRRACLASRRLAPASRSSRQRSS